MKTIRRTELRIAPDFSRREAAAFTLIELILIMAVLAITVSLVLPRLSDFFRGRVIEAETRQLISLMRHGQNRAVGEGVPVVLWIDTRQGTYGIEQEPGFEDRDTRAVELKLAPELQFEVPDEGRSTGPTRVGLVTGPRAGLPQIRFLPDSTISENSPPTIRLVSRDGTVITLGLSIVRNQYEVLSQDNSRYATR